VKISEVIRAFVDASEHSVAVFAREDDYFFCGNKKRKGQEQ
jgi:hypothetical protein